MSSVMFAMTPVGALEGNAGSKDGNPPRLRNWNPPPTPARLSPITALLCTASIATPQFVHLPPEKRSSPDPLLVRVWTKLVPDIKYTSVLFALHTVCPEIGFGAQELVTLGVAIFVGIT